MSVTQEVELLPSDDAHTGKATQWSGERWNHTDESARARSFVVGAVALVVGALLRWWQVQGRAPSWWQDSEDYWAVSRNGFWSMWWGAGRAPGVPLLLWLTGGKPGAGFMYGQVVLAALCWAWLAGELVRSTCRSWSRAVGLGVVVLGFSLSTPMLLWDRSVLSESMTLSLLAAVVAAALRFARMPTWWRALLVVSVAAAWALTRDTTAMTLVVGAVAGMWCRRFEAVRFRTTISVALGLLVVAAMSVLSAEAGQRSDLPVAHVYEIRVLPYPDRVAWFAERGMPDGERFAAVAASLDPASQPPVVGVPDDDSTYARWWRWVNEDGRTLLLRWIVTHPSYVWSEPMQHPERVFNNAEGSVGFYAAGDRPGVPFVSEIFWPATPLVLGLVGLSGAVGWRRYRHPEMSGGTTLSVLVVAALLVGSSGLTALVAWHTDGMESARHLLPSAAQLRLGLVLAAAALVARERSKDPVCQCASCREPEKLG